MIWRMAQIIARAVIKCEPWLREQPGENGEPILRSVIEAAREFQTFPEDWVSGLLPDEVKRLEVEAECLLPGLYRPEDAERVSSDCKQLREKSAAYVRSLYVLLTFFRALRFVDVAGLHDAESGGYDGERGSSWLDRFLREFDHQLGAAFDYYG